MLLSRVTQHVKDQNWFAVGTDFLIVVTGLFRGTQLLLAYCQASLEKVEQMGGEAH